MDQPSTTLNLTPEQQDTAVLVRRLLGGRFADRYIDFCRLSAGALPLRASTPIAAHALRELESILRETLRGPMDASVVAGPEELGRIDQAVAALKTIGFDQDQIKNAVDRGLRGSRHKKEIEMIVTRLGLAPDGDIAQAWRSISSAHGKAHGARALDQTLAVDDDFRAEWQAPFEIVIRGVMIALKGKYAAFMQRAGELAAMPDRSRAAALFVREIPGSLPLLWHFFNSLKSPDWIPLLAKRNLLSPPSEPDEAVANGVLLGPWPAGLYLLRMAKAGEPFEHHHVIEVLQKIDPNSDGHVKQIAMEILAALPADLSAPLVEVAESWLAPEAIFLMAQGPHDLIRTLAKDGQSDAALRLARALFKVFDRDGRLATLFSRHMYEHFLPISVKALAPVRGVETVCLLTELLDRALRISGKVGDDPAHDYTYYLAREISERGIKHDVIDSLAGETVRAAKLTIEADPACTKAVVLAIERFRPRLFTRIALHVLSLRPGSAPDLSQEYLTAKGLLEATWCRIEYGQLAQAWFPSLPESIRATLLAAVDAAPDVRRDIWKTRFEEYEKRPPTAEDEAVYDRAVKRDLVWQWRSVLSPERRADVEAAGDPDAWREQLSNAPSPPMAAADFISRPIEDTVSFLKTWRPATGVQHETMTALARELRSAVEGDPAYFSAQADSFAALPAAYVRNVLQGLESAANNRKPIDWNGAFRLVVAATMSADDPHSVSSMEGDDPDWSWTRKAAGELFAAGLRQGNNGIPFESKNAAWTLIKSLWETAPRDPDADNFEELYRKFPHFAAQATWRGQCIELAVLFMFWLSRFPGSDIGKDSRKALEMLPDVQAIFDSELKDQSVAGRIPRAILGRYLSWLYYFGEPWLRRNLSILMPPDDVSLRDAAWLAHLIGDRGPVVSLAAQMRDCYEVEIHRISKSDPNPDRQDFDKRLAEYMVVLYINSALPDEVFELFWTVAPPSARQEAMWFLSTIIEPSAQLPAAQRARAYSYWDRRLAAAKASATRELFRQEIGTIGQFFYRDGIEDDWLLDQLLLMVEAGLVPSDPYNVVERLAKMSERKPERVLNVLAALVKTPQFDQLVYMTQKTSIRTILANGKAMRSARSAELVSETVSHIAAIGDGSYVDLLADLK